MGIELNIPFYTVRKVVCKHLPKEQNSQEFLRK